MRTVEVAKKDWLDRLFDLFARLGSEFEGERETTRLHLDKLLKRHGRTWNDLPGLLAAVQERRAPPSRIMRKILTSAPNSRPR